MYHHLATVNSLSHHLAIHADSNCIELYVAWLP